MMQSEQYPTYPQWMGRDCRNLELWRSGCSPTCKCSDFHGMTAEGHHYPLCDRPACVVCGDKKYVERPPRGSNTDWLCPICRETMTEVNALLNSFKAESVEGRRILRHAAYYVLHRYHYWDFVSRACDEQWATNMVASQYVQVGPAYVLRKSL